MLFDPLKEPDSSAHGQRDSQFEELWTALIGQPLVDPASELMLRQILALLTKPEFNLRTDLPLDQNHAGALNLADRQELQAIEERIGELLKEAGTPEVEITIRGRLSYVNEEGQQIHSLLLSLRDLSGSPCMYQMRTGTILRTGGEVLTEVASCFSDRLVSRHHYSVEAVRNEIARIAEDWSSFFIAGSNQQFSTVIDSAWSLIKSRHPSIKDDVIPEMIGVYADEDLKVFHLRFDLDQWSSVVRIDCTDQAFSPCYREYSLESDIIDMGLRRVRCERGKGESLALVRDSLLTDEQISEFSGTFRFFEHPRQKERMWESLRFHPRVDVLPPLLEIERMVRQYVQSACARSVGEIDRIELLPNKSPAPHPFNPRFMVGLVASTRDGHFVLNTSQTSCLYEYGPVGVMLCGDGYTIDRILPLYSRQAFCEELGVLSAAATEDMSLILARSHLLHIALAAPNAAILPSHAAIEQITVSSPSAGSDRVCLEVQGAGHRFSTLIERAPMSGMVSVVSPLTPWIPRHFRW